MKTHRLLTLASASLIGLALVFAACGSDSSKNATPTVPPTPTPTVVTEPSTTPVESDGGGAPNDGLHTPGPHTGETPATGQPAGSDFPLPESAIANVFDPGDKEPESLTSWKYLAYNKTNFSIGDKVRVSGDILWFTNDLLDSKAAFWKTYVWSPWTCGAIVQCTSNAGCIYYQVTFHEISASGTVSYPPLSGSVTFQGLPVSNGLVRSCKAPGAAYTPYFILGDTNWPCCGPRTLQHSSYTMTYVTLKICWSDKPEAKPAYCDDRWWWFSPF